MFAEADNPTVEVAYNESYSILGNQETENEQGESAKGSSEISISIDYGEFGDERSEDEVVNLHIPKTTLIDRGSFEITSDNAVLFSKELSTKEFYNGSDYYGYSVLFKDLNLNDVNGNALMEVNFNYNDGNPKNITKLAFLSSKDNIVSFNFLKTRDGDLWDDPVALLISDFPDGVDDEFIIFTDHFGEIINLKWKISELTRNEEGLYVWHCSGLGIPELLFYDIGDDDINLRIQFFKDGKQAENYSCHFRSFWGPWFIGGKYSKEDCGVINFFSLLRHFDDEFTVYIYGDNLLNSSKSFKFSEMGKYYHPDKDVEESGDWYFTLDDLGIDENGKYNLSVVFTKDGEKTYYNATANVQRTNTKITVSDLNTVYRGGEYLVATLSDSNGTVLKNTKATVKINGRTLEVTTNKKGRIFVSLNSLAPNKKAYIATFSFAGNFEYVKSSASAKVIVNKANMKLIPTIKKYSAKVKTKIYYVTAKDNKNQAFKNVWVTFKVKGKTYYAKTNKKGVAIFKVGKLTKKGVYKAVIGFSGSKYYNAISQKINVKVK